MKKIFRFLDKNQSINKTSEVINSAEKDLPVEILKEESTPIQKNRRQSFAGWAAEKPYIRIFTPATTRKRKEKEYVRRNDEVLDEKDELAQTKKRWILLKNTIIATKLTLKSDSLQDPYESYCGERRLSFLGQQYSVNVRFH
ncbi:uncharacterized protein LOC111705972 isoform X2 [Eurytemora carolleeae]|uniref:uncharacterized protein LOC111705972 isoform X2 n=1 Tax=Eurytemora carolleeae TaxID=1294199 RepID=UPI000C78E67C|nr:uncharacterized protein LOC111705972 isoform X2 [Eurytemora carolleeae]|eukprot:XP_023334464.1 uncharacterized protein LOC111705972 isoform X2 [Eurytemora affinis]